MKVETKTFKSGFSKLINDFLKEQEIVGKQKKTYIYQLKSFDTYCYNNFSNMKIITKDLLEKWLSSSSKNILQKAYVIRKFSIYVNNLYEKSYILPYGIYNNNSRHIPYIFSDEEIKSFFKTVDNYALNNKDLILYCSLQIIFRLLYMCGMRISEVLNLKIDNFQGENNILIIYNSKGYKDRIIPINTTLSKLITNYIKRFHIYQNKDEFLFLNNKNKAYSRFSIYYRFRIFLRDSNIKHTSNGPRLHDFRHTNAVHCLRNFVKNNYNLNTYLPILQTYLGHSSFKDTAYYLRITPDLFGDIKDKVYNKYGDIIPSLEIKDNEK